MPGPVLGVDRIVLYRGVEPEAVALVAMVEGPFELAAAAAASAPASAATPAAALRAILA